MRRIRIALAGFFMAAVPGCGAVKESSTEGEDSAEQPLSDVQQATEEGAGEGAEEAVVSGGEPDDCEPTGEQIGEARQASGVGNACVATCAASYALLCHRVRTICAVAEVVTIGEATIPCATALLAACVGGAALGAICAHQCPP